MVEVYFWCCAASCLPSPDQFDLLEKKLSEPQIHTNTTTKYNTIQIIYSWLYCASNLYGQPSQIRHFVFNLKQIVPKSQHNIIKSLIQLSVLKVLYVTMWY